MASWKALTDEAPELAGQLRASLDAHRHKVLATLRADGSPRVSGTEVFFSGDDLWIGSMDGARKGADLRRDPRFALHSAPLDLELTKGDVKLSGRVELVDDPTTTAAITSAVAESSGQEPDEPFDLFRADLSEAVLVTVAGDELVIESWHQGRGTSRTTRH
jgi:hypothetical protein